MKGASHSKVMDYSLDHLGDLPMMAVPTQGGKAAKMQRKLYRSLSTELPNDLKQKLVTLLAAEFSKKVGLRVGGWGSGAQGSRV